MLHEERVTKTTSGGSGNSMADFVWGRGLVTGIVAECSVGAGGLAMGFLGVEWRYQESGHNVERTEQGRAVAASQEFLTPRTHRTRGCGPTASLQCLSRGCPPEAYGVCRHYATARCAGGCLEPFSDAVLLWRGTQHIIVLAHVLHNRNVRTVRASCLTPHMVRRGLSRAWWWWHCRHHKQHKATRMRGTLFKGRKTTPGALQEGLSGGGGGISAEKLSGGENVGTPKFGCLVYSCG